MYLLFIRSVIHISNKLHNFVLILNTSIQSRFILFVLIKVPNLLTRKSEVVRRVIMLLPVVLRVRGEGALGALEPRIPDVDLEDVSPAVVKVLCGVAAQNAVVRVLAHLLHVLSLVVPFRLA